MDGWRGIGVWTGPVVHDENGHEVITEVLIPFLPSMACLWKGDDVYSKCEHYYHIMSVVRSMSVIMSQITLISDTNLNEQINNQLKSTLILCHALVRMEGL